MSLLQLALLFTVSLAITNASELARRRGPISPNIKALQEKLFGSTVPPSPQVNSAPTTTSVGIDGKTSSFEQRAHDSAALSSQPVFVPQPLSTAAKAAFEGTETNAPPKPAAATTIANQQVDFQESPSTTTPTTSSNVKSSIKFFEGQTPQPTPQPALATSRGPFKISDKIAEIQSSTHIPVGPKPPAKNNESYAVLMSKMYAAMVKVESLFKKSESDEMVDETLSELIESWREEYDRLFSEASAMRMANASDEKEKIKVWLENTEKLADLLENSFCAAKDDRKWTPLQIAMMEEKADVQKIEKLLANPYLDTPANFDQALKIATMNGYEEIAELLLKDGRANYIGASEKLSSEMAHNKMKRLFKDLVPFLESINPNGPDPLVWVMESQDLLEKLSRKQYEIVLARARNFPKLVKYLKGKEEHLENIWKAKLNDLLDAASSNESTKAENLLAKIDPSVDGSMALQKACEKSSLDVIQVLLQDRRSNPAAGNGICLVPFIKLNRLDLGRTLLESTEVDVMLNEGEALRQAILSKNVELVEAVLNKAKFKYLKEVDSPEGNKIAQTLKQIHNLATDDNIRGLISTAFPDVNFEESYWDYMKSYLPTYWM